MRAKLLQDQEITNPAIKSLDDLARLRARVQAGEISPAEYTAARKQVAVAGTVIEHPQAYGLVLRGIAEPDDQECIDRVGAVRLRRMAERVDAANKLDVAQATGLSFDASDDAVSSFKTARRARREAMEHVEGTVAPQ